MNQAGIAGVQKRRFKPLGTQSDHRFGYSANVLKQTGKPTGQNQVWVADTTYLLTDQGWKYLATVMNLCSRRIIGWSVSSSNDTDLVIQALRAAVLYRGKLPEGTIHHSDRGSTYASDNYQRLLRSFSMEPSMSGKGNCYDNAAMESFYGRYKSSSVRGHIFPMKTSFEQMCLNTSKYSTTDSESIRCWNTKAQMKRRVLVESERGLSSGGDAVGRSTWNRGSWIVRCVVAALTGDAVKDWKDGSMLRVSDVDESEPVASESDA